MANEKISAMTDIGSLVASDVVPVVRSGDPTNYNASMTEVNAYIQATNPTYIGEMRVNTTTSAVSMPSANTDYKLTNGWVTGTVNGFTFSTDSLIVTNSGTYEVEVSLSATSGSATSNVIYGVQKNGTALGNNRATDRVPTSPVTTAWQFVAAFTAGDTIDICAQTNQASNSITLLRANLIVKSATGGFGPQGPQGPTGPSGGPTGPTGPTGPAAYLDAVADYGAVGDCVQYQDGTITLGAPDTLVCPSNPFVAGDLNKPIEVSDALGVGSAPLLTTISSVINSGTVVLTSPATNAIGSNYYANTATVVDAGSSGNYAPGDTMTVTGGTAATTTVLTVVKTQIRASSVAISAAGSGGTDGRYRWETSAGVGAPAKGTCVVSGGGVTSVLVTRNGVFTTNPGTLSAIPITITGSGVTGATISANMDVMAAAPSVDGDYTVVPTDPVATGASSPTGGTGATFTISWTRTGKFQYGTDNFTALSDWLNAFNASTSQVSARLPAGIYGLFSGSGLPKITRAGDIFGDGPASSRIQVTEGYTGAWVLAPKNLFPSAGQFDISGPIYTTSSLTNRLRIALMAIGGNQSTTVRPDAVRCYDRVDGLWLEDMLVENMAGVLTSGYTDATSRAYLRESMVRNVMTRSCGTTSQPQIILDAATSGNATNETQFVECAFIGPQGGVFWFKQAKTIKVTSCRIEYEGSDQAVANSDLIKFGSPTTTFQSIQKIDFVSLSVISPPAGYSGIAFYGTTTSGIPAYCAFTDLRIFGAGAGNGISIYSGQSLSFDIKQLSTGGTDILIDSRTDNRRNSTVGTGSTTSAIVLDAGASATNDYYTGGALVISGETRQITAYNGSTKTATVGSLQGSAATFTGAPTVGTAYSIISLIEGPLFITSDDTRAQLQWSVGTNASTAIRGRLAVDGVPTGEMTVYDSLAFKGPDGYEVGAPTGGALGYGKVNASGGFYVNGTAVGTVSSVAETFTGGIISVSGSPITTSGTLALTVAGTSGGIPYFNSGTSWLSSGALAANSVVIGGGAGAAPTGAVLPTGWTITSGTIVPSNTIVLGLSNDLVNTLPLGTYDLGPFINGGTVLNSYAHVASGTITYSGAIGAPGTYTAITGLSSITSNSTTVDTIGTATAANTLSAGQHLWLVVGGTAAAGGSVFFTVKVP